MRRSLLAVAFLAATIGFTGCSKEESPEREPENPAVMNVDEVVSLMGRYRTDELDEARLVDLIEHCFYLDLPDDYDLVPDALPQWEQIQDDPAFTGAFSDEFQRTMDRLQGLDPLAYETYEAYCAASRAVLDDSGLERDSQEYYALDAALTYSFAFLDDTLQSEYGKVRSWSSFWRSVGRCAGNIFGGALVGLLQGFGQANYGEFLVTGALGAIGGALQGLGSCF